MSTSTVKIEALVVEVSCTADLRRATPAQCANWRLLGGGVGVHWPDVDEDVSAAQQNSIS